MVALDTLRGEKKAAILRLAGTYGARSIRVFGSVARGDNRETAMSISWWSSRREEHCST